jgi:hypothetical protein
MTLAEIQERLQVFNDPRFRFEAEAHEYYLADRLLVHFSEWLKGYKDPFDEEGVSQSMAAWQNCSPQVFLDEWKFSREVIGTGTHNYIEHYLTHGHAPEHEHAEVRLRCAKFRQLHQAHLLGFDSVAIEQRLFDEASGHCGTLDWLPWHREREELWVFDWKTNKNFTSGKDRPKGAFRPGLFADLPALDHVVYSIQNGFYRVLLERVGIPTAGGVLVHLPPGDRPAKMYKAYDYRERIEAILFPSRPTVEKLVA